MGLSCKKVTNYIKSALIGAALSISPTVAAAKTPVAKECVKNLTADTKAFTDMFKFRHPSFIKSDVMKQGLESDIFTGKFKRALDIYKKELKNDLDIKENDYKIYTKAIDKIGQGERTISSDLEIIKINSEYEYFEDDYDDITEIFDLMFPQKQPVSFNEDCFNIRRINKSEKEIFDKYGIELSKNNFTPEQKAIMTMVHLSRLDKNYETYLKTMKKIKPNLDDAEVQKSIQNAKSLLSDENVAEHAIDALYNFYEDFSVLSIKNGRFEIKQYSKKDLDDLKIFASTIVLPREEYLVQRWFSHPVTPSGKYKDRACAHILSLYADGELDKFPTLFR